MTCRHRSILCLLPDLAIACIALAYIYMSAFISRIGDDVFYSHVFESFPNFINTISDTFKINGRTSSYLVQILLNLSYPRPLLALLNGIGIAALCYAIIRIIKIPRSKPLSRLAVILAILLIPQWEFLANEWCALIIYVWCGAIALFILNFAFSNSPTPSSLIFRYLFYPLIILWAILAGGFNEALSADFIIAIPVTLLFLRNSYKIPTRRLVILWTLTVSSFVPLLSPYLFAHQNIPFPYTAGQILFVSAWPVFLLIATSFLMYFFRRPTLLKLINSPWIFYYISAITTLPGIIVAGYPGRPAWFGQLFAIIAISQILLSFPFPKSILKNIFSQHHAIIAYLLLSVIIFHISAVAFWQHKVGVESRQLITQIQTPEASRSFNNVYLDYTPNSAAPWPVLYKTHGVPDADDTQPCLQSLYYGYNFNIPFSILPKALKGMTYKEIDKNSPFRIGRFYVSAKPISQHNISGEQQRLKIVQYNRPYENFEHFPAINSRLFINDTLYIESPFPVYDNRPGPSNAPVALLYTPVKIDPAQI